ncbi:MAG: cell wall-binding repeat-containing protein [Parvibaculum sp.]|uniref:cell wall-binding repeat-containing protein n=1 Tax=Parvibaculum sp. TaxID=2024848 RepID=UPI00272F35CD|nr:cell wall-binding repeat-containing protein [Parvibaculum sp.]MDP2151214.1 cell wall-binding repeat-containing protein [Parvibaculum sp.]
MLGRAFTLARLLVASLLLSALFPVVPAVAVPNDDVLPGVPMHVDWGPYGSLGLAETYDVFWVQLQNDQELTIRWHGQAGLSATMVVLTPSAASPAAAPVATSSSPDGAEAILRYREAAGPGRYYVVVRRISGSGNYSNLNTTISTDNELGVSLYRGYKSAVMSTATSKHVWTIWARRGTSLTGTLVDPAGVGDDFDIEIYTDDGTGSPNSLPKVGFGGTGDTMIFSVSAFGLWGAGDYSPIYVHVTREAGSGPYSLSWTTDPAPAYVERVSGADRFEVAQELGVYTRWPYYSHVSDIVVASGDDAAMADPLSAGGLCWAYNAPLLLVSKNSAKNAETLIRIADIRGFSGKVRVHVVGGTSTIPSSIYEAIKTAAGGAAYIERIDGTNRYDVARKIALRMRDVRSDHLYGVLFANGADPEKFFDALALSAIAAHNGMPILLVKKDSIPNETKSALSAMTSTSPRYLAGGTSTVSSGVATELGITERWAGADRYATAREVADRAYVKGLLHTDNIAIASKLPDALSAGADVGFIGGPVLVVKSDALPASTRAFLDAHSDECERLWPVGGPVSIKQSVIDAAANALN